MPSPTESLASAIQSFPSQRAFAEALSIQRGRRVSSQAISQWKEKGVPADSCEPIEAITGGRQRVEDLRPDIQWQRDAKGRVVGFHPPPVPIKPTRRRRRAPA